MDAADLTLRARDGFELAGQRFGPGEAGGKVGFEDIDLFNNLPVSCSHLHKGFGIHLDYSNLAYAIGSLELYRCGIAEEGKRRINIGSSVGDGDLFWNRVVSVRREIDGLPGRLDLEQFSARPGSYRAIWTADGSDERRRIARSAGLQHLLKQFDVQMTKSGGL